MVHGRARWFLFPPAKALYSSKQIFEWCAHSYLTANCAAHATWQN
jgi:hypothetical protein